MSAVVLRRRAVALVVLLLILVALDLGRAGDDQWTTRAAVAGIHLYQATFSKVYARMGVQCRFTPTCSYYGEASVRQWGAARGGWLAVKRVLRCGPWTPMGTVDPPPPRGA